MADLEFPWAAFMQAAQQRIKNQQAGPELIGQGLSTAGQVAGSALQARAQKMQQLKQQKQLNDWLQSQAAANAPQQKTMNVQGRPNTPIASYDPSSDTTAPTMTPGNPQMQQLFSGLASAPPTIQQRALPQMFAQEFKGTTGGAGGKPQGSYFVNPQDPTQISPTAQPGWIEYKTSQADAGSKVTSSAQSKLRTQAMEGRVKAWERSIDVKQINEMAKSVGFTPKMISSLQNTAVRGQRALELLSKPNITWQELHAAGVDFAGIMQGGAPHVGEVVNSTFPNWQEDVGKWNTYITGDVPTTVPTEIRLKLMDMSAHVVALDKKFIEASNTFQKKFVGPTLPGGITPAREKAINDVQGAMVPGPAAGGNFSSMSDDELLRIAGGGR